MNAMAPPFPTNPSVGDWFGNWVWNGVRWVCVSGGGIIAKITVMVQSGPYMPSPGLVWCMVECVGGGGAGGFVVNEAGSFAAGGGGGSGGYSKSAFPAALVAGGVNVTIGVGGSGAVDPNYDKTQSGGGGQTTFGALVMAPGGGNAFAFFPSKGSYGGHGWRGQGGIGQLTFDGHPGQTWATCDNPSDNGRPWGVAGVGGAIISGNSGTNSQFDSEDGNSANGGSGAGGTGAQSNYETAGTQRPGGDGGSGFVVITEYCWADQQADDCLNPPINVNARVAVTHVPWQGPGPCPPGWGGGPYLESDD